ncbi:hypothetical protein ACFQ0I_02780 [Mariniflexile aquimaris]|uniref:Uncharacterized protein n=1 Tax=Mariniflexile aquimaris TaxID=881009 RepID=A0ABW3BNM9_9FLAO
MKLVFKKIFFLVIFSGIILTILNLTTFKNMFFSDKVYVLFDNKIDMERIINWEVYSDMFPKNFNPKKVNVDITELLKLNQKQKFQFDSIINLYYKYPQKTIKVNNGIKDYSISIDTNFLVGFKVLNKKKIKKSKVKDLNFISIDSVIQLIPDVHNGQIKKIEFYIVDKEKDNIIIHHVNPYIIEYN